MRIAVEWSEGAAPGARDANRGFRTRVIDRVLATEAEIPPLLLRDLFVEEARWSELADVVSPTFPKLAQLFLSRTGTTYLSEFLEGSIANFSTYGACHLMTLEPGLTLTLLNETRRRLQMTTDEKQRGPLNLGESLFAKIQKGTAREGWYVADTRNNPIGRLQKYWIGLTRAIWQKLRRKNTE